MSDNRARLRLKNKLEDITDYEGRNTELVTLFIPPGDNIQKRLARLRNEYAEADNIKDDQTSQNVQDAVGKARRLLESYEEIPENGLVIYTGQTKDDGFVSYVLDDLPSPIEQSEYFCGDHFKTEPLAALVRPQDAYGLVVVTRDQGVVGQLAGDNIVTIREIESEVMGKTRAGGQSAQRFARVREKQKEEHFKKVAQAVRDAFIDESTNQAEIEGLLVGGTNGTVDEFVNNDYLDYRLEEIIVGTFNVSVGDQTGLRNLVDKGERVLEEHGQAEAKQHVQEFFRSIPADDKHAAYGEEEIGKALEYGAVGTLLLSENLPGEQIDDLSERAENIGADVVLIPITFEEAERFDNPDAFGGIGAILRYEI